MEIKDLEENKFILLDCISGSRAYGLDIPESDTDKKGVFLMPKNQFYGLDYIPQVSNYTNDVVYFELNRYMELLSVNNPNILELLNTPSEFVLYKNKALEIIKAELIISKLCKNTFGKFAISQIKKAKGLNKKIVNPIAKERKTLLEFCFVNYNGGSIPLNKFLKIKVKAQSECGLVKIPHMKDVYGLYLGRKGQYKGIVKKSDSNEISLSAISRGEKQDAVLFFNKDGYSTYCKEYKEYWNWVEKRNSVRYESTMSHGKNYDAKNMMHTFRLLEMAIEIAKDHKVNVRRPNRDFLLEIKSGKFEYDELLSMAQEKQRQMEDAFENSTLPERPDINLINKMCFELREELYQSQKI
ncbi:MAG: nucleotidyltransferase domain-containing protein [Crocinitomicaceae bacterium]